MRTAMGAVRDDAPSFEGGVDARKTTTKPAPGQSDAQPKQAAPAATGKRRATIRMYRWVSVIVSCSVFRARTGDFASSSIAASSGAAGAADRIKNVQDLKKITAADRRGGRTHEHQDHLSDSPRSRMCSEKGCAGELWVAWTKTRRRIRH